jgi:hypothetical protein
MDDSEIFEAARSIRPYLHILIPDEVVAGLVDRELAQHLNQAQSGKPNANVILGILCSHEATRQWVSEFLEQHQPPEVTRAFSFQPIVGNPVPVAAGKYVCPLGDYTWYRPAAGTPVPRCPTHVVTLVAAP